MSTSRLPAQYQELPLRYLDPARVEALWRYEAAALRRQLILPDGRMDLVAHCTVASGGRVSAVWLAIAGPADAPATLAVRPGMVSFGARFHIGWGGACLGVNPVSVRNQSIVGHSVVRLLGLPAQRILRARTLEDAQHGLADAASVAASRAPTSQGHQRAMDAIGQMLGTARHAGSGQHPGTTQAAPRTLRRDILAAAGLPLRTLAGILRFQHAMALLNAGAPSLSHVAVDAGYSDQAHMTREFRRFGGFTPALPVPAPVVGVACGRAVAVTFNTMARRSGKLD